MQRGPQAFVRPRHRMLRRLVQRGRVAGIALTHLHLQAELRELLQLALEQLEALADLLRVRACVRT